MFFFQDIEQLEIILEESLNLPIFKSPGYEADDLLGTIANDASSKGWCVNILSGDRDLFQLVDDQKDIYVLYICLLYTSPSPRDTERSRMPSSA